MSVRRDPPDPSAAGAASADLHEVVVYTRPGCPFCVALRAGLRRAGLSFREVDIWEDPAAAAFVRSIAGGNETVPTVTVGEVSMVNPSARHVCAIARPGALPEPTRRRWLRRDLRPDEPA